MNIKTASYQELFNIMWTGLENQGWKRSMIKDTKICAYRGGNGRKCAIGHCIDDDNAYCWEGVSINTINRRADLNIEPERLTFLMDCQRSHDGAILDGEMEEIFRNIAKKYNLTIPGE